MLSKSKRIRTLALALALSLSATRGHTFVTSAILEFSSDDQLGFYLNGNTLLQVSVFEPFSFQALSTADGTLPLEMFDTDGDNLLACRNTNGGGESMGAAYRLTVHHSDGDPVVIWSVPEQAKMLHVIRPAREPEGWNQINFNDSAWRPATLGFSAGIWAIWPQLSDASFGNFLGLNGYVPFMSHNKDGMANSSDVNIFRSHFRFPVKPAKVVAIVQPSSGRVGQNIAIRLVPGPDSANFSQFNLLAWLPKGLDFVSASPGGTYDPATRRVSWSSGAKALGVHYLKLPAVRVDSASGWTAPQLALGPLKPELGNRIQINVTDAVFNRGTSFGAKRPGWFSLQTPAPEPGTPKILGVIFRTQLRSSASKVNVTDSDSRKEIDPVFFNYSVDGRLKGALKKDVEVSRNTNSGEWYDGYYDASEDRAWTWADVQNVKVKIESSVRGNQERILMAGTQMIVRVYQPAAVSNYCYVKVTEPRCATLEIKAGLFRAGAKLVTSDAVEFPINQQACAPTPVPTPTMAPPPPRLPTPEPTLAPQVTPKPKIDPGTGRPGEIQLGLGCLSANPEPFNFAGTFINFCLKQDADVTINIYNAKTGALVRGFKAGNFRGGDSQVFYNAMDDKQRPLLPGEYVYELVAEKKGVRESRNSLFHFKKDRR